MVIFAVYRIGVEMNMRKLRILVTGDTGLLGGNITRTRSEKYDIIGVALENNPHRGIDHRTADLCMDNYCSTIVEEVRPDIIINAAAYLGVDNCEEHPDKAYIVNTLLPINLAKYAEKYHSHLIHISTDAFYYGAPGNMCSETVIPHVRNVYGETKLEAEKQVLKYERTTVLRTNIYGYNLMNKLSQGEWILYSLLNNQTLHMFVDAETSGILVNDLIDVIDQVIKAHTYGLYNAGSSGTITRHEFAMALRDTFGIGTGNIVEARLEEHSYVARRSHNTGMDNTRIKDALGTRIPTPVECIEHFYALYKEGYHERLRKP